MEVEDGIAYIKMISSWYDNTVQNISNELEQVSSGENDFKNIRQHVWS